MSDAFNTRLMYGDYISESENGIKKLQKEYEEKSKLYKHVFSSEIGLKVIEDLENNFLEGPSFIPGRNSHDVCYFEGQKSVLAYVKRMLTLKLKD